MEELEKYFERVKEIFGFDGYIANMIYTDEEQKQKLKQILEEIENNTIRKHQDKNYKKNYLKWTNRLERGKRR